MVAENAPIAVLGPSTGLGISGLIRDDSGHWTPLSGEGGHVSLPIRLETDYRLWQFAHERFPGHLSAERFLSGSWITLIDQALASFDGKSSRRDAAEVTAASIWGRDFAVYSRIVCCGTIRRALCQQRQDERVFTGSTGFFSAGKGNRAARSGDRLASKTRAP